MICCLGNLMLVNSQTNDSIVSRQETVHQQSGFGLAYPWQSLVGKEIEFIGKETGDNFLGYQNFYIRKDLRAVYASNTNGRTDPKEMIGKKFRVLKVEEGFRSTKSELGVLLFLQNLAPSNFLYKQLYYVYAPDGGNPFLFKVGD